MELNAIFLCNTSKIYKSSTSPEAANTALSTCTPGVSSLDLARGELSLDLCWLSPDNENILFSIKQLGSSHAQSELSAPLCNTVSAPGPCVVTVAVAKCLQHRLSANNEPWEAGATQTQSQLLCRVHTESSVIAVFQPLSVFLRKLRIKLVKTIMSRPKSAAYLLVLLS